MAPYQTVQVRTEEQLNDFCQPPTLPALDLGTVRRHEADAHWLVAEPGGAVVARGSLWWSQVPTHPLARVGIIGHYAARNAVGGTQLLQQACRQLAGEGCTMAVGPMDGNTWRSHRLVLEPGTDPAFFLEPQNPADWPGHFTRNGFTILARYDSRVNHNMQELLPSLDRVNNRLVRRGFSIRPLRPNHLEQELHRLFELSLASFGQNFLYMPISQAEFMAMYAPLEPYIVPELTLLAEYDGVPTGFIFALPDLLQARRGDAIDTVIIKSVAVHPAYRVGGIGSLLVARCQETAGRLGYRRAIHALMHDGNTSGKISRRNQSRLLRRYALFSKTL